MVLEREFFDGALTFTVVMGVLNAALIAWQVQGPHRLRRLPLGEGTQLLAVLMLSAAAAAIVTGQPHPALLTLVGALLLTASIRAWLPRLTMAGALDAALAPLSVLVMLPWSYCFLRDSQFPEWSMTLWKALLVVAVLGFGLSFASKLAQQALLTHRHWRRPTTPLPEGTGHGLKVSLHVPCYSEPPDMVIRTLDHLHRLDYGDYEVLVCDNNTEDPALWRPVAEHCRRLNAMLGFERFRFFHVSPLSGAKAGALNFCLDRTAADARLVGVLDADYVARPDFLDRLVGFFDDRNVGYVQTSHDYRDHKFSRYLRMCYWEYLPYYKVDMASINEYDAAFTIGTMCLFRKQVLQDCGRWGEWCLTEDSEVSIRIRALGYQGVFLRSTFGRGLIPELFEHYKKQRFRWAAGPVQQLRRHWRLFLPVMLGGRPGLNGWSKLLEFQRASECLMLGPLTLLGLVGMGAVLGLTDAGQLPRIVLPDIVWLLLPLAIGTQLVSKWLWYRLGGCMRVSDMVGGEIARMSLAYVKMTASFAGMSRKPLKWHRTPKFKARSLGARAMLSALPETAIALAFTLLAVVLLVYHERFGPHLGLLAAAGAAAGSVTFWSSTVMAWLSERELVRRSAAEPAVPQLRTTAEPTRLDTATDVASAPFHAASAVAHVPPEREATLAQQAR
jgi:cellulose synthase/poly-beta-1,6-N-acetylglucosamine synthase-like glycosyltransferase